MSNGYLEVSGREVRQLVSKLVDFLGPIRIQKEIDRYQRRLRDAGEIHRIYIRREYLWLEAFQQYYDLDSAAKSIRRHLTPELRALMTDAKMIVDLLPSMPDSVRTKYRTNLVGAAKAGGYLFEIFVARHFAHMGYSILWSEPGNKKQPEFLVKADSCQFNVECKRISVDKCRKIHRKDFIRFADRLIPKIRDRNYFGRITLDLNQRLPADDASLNRLVEETVQLLEQGESQVSCETPSGSVSLDLAIKNNVVVDLSQLHANLWDGKGADACGVVHAERVNGRLANPIELVAASRKSDGILKGMKQEILCAGKEQLDPLMPAFIACFLEEVDDLKELGTNSDLQRMTYDVLARDELSHVAAIAYQGETVVHGEPSCQIYANPGLVFRNPNCRFEQARELAFLWENDDSREWQFAKE